MKYEVKYVISLHDSKFGGYQSKSNNKGIVKAYVSTIYKGSYDYDTFVIHLIHIILHERICLERAFNKIRIKGGMCNPCCVESIANSIMDIIKVRK